MQNTIKISLGRAPQVKTCSTFLSFHRFTHSCNSLLIIKKQVPPREKVEKANEKLQKIHIRKDKEIIFEHVEKRADLFDVYLHRLYRARGGGCAYFTLYKGHAIIYRRLWYYLIYTRVVAVPPTPTLSSHTRPLDRIRVFFFFLSNKTT